MWLCIGCTKWSMHELSMYLGVSKGTRSQCLPSQFVLVIMRDSLLQDKKFAYELSWWVSTHLSMHKTTL
jgi:hypothetical protein